MNIKPLNDKIVVKVVPQEEKTQSGIVLPESAQKKPQVAEVLAVGSGKLLESGQRVASEVKVGDKVYFARYTGSEVNIDGQDLLILGERDILAILG